MNETKQHTALKSILLHLLPGVFILTIIIAFSKPAFPRFFGFDDRLGPIVGYLSGILFGLLPIQLGILLFANKKETGNNSLSRVIRFTDKSHLKDYLIYIPVFIAYFLVLFIAIAPLIQPYIIQTFFSWWPEQYNFQLLLQNPSTIADFQGIKILGLLYILLSGILGPLVEEFYFRGYLLPRMDGYAGKWAPLVNTVLFSLYHFFSPWENLIRIAASYPLIHLVWKKRDIRFGIFVHILTNTLGGIAALIIIS
jgi:membrane protease YdiL (CAAX protease family)